MNLMLKKMQQKPVHPLTLNTRATVHLNEALQTMRVQAFHNSDQAPIHICLRQPALCGQWEYSQEDALKKDL